MTTTDRTELRLGHRPPRLALELETGAHFQAVVMLQAGPGDPSGTPEGEPMDWPEGTTCWLEIRNQGGGAQQRWDATVDGAFLRWSVPPEKVNMVARSAWADLWLHYPDSEPWLWREGPVSWQ